MPTPSTLPRRWTTRAALNVADRGYVLEMGEVAVQGPADQLIHDQRVIDTYLGVGGARAAAA